jgi:hypothetical protein
VFYSGGHDPLWDLANDMNSIGIIQDFYASGKPVAAVYNKQRGTNNAGHPPCQASILAQNT